MPIVQLIIGMIVAMAFLALFVWVAWYVAIPILVILGVLSGVRWLQQQWQLYQIRRDSNGCTIRKSSTRIRPETTVIDVDYTEIQ